jgi:hypothetical protein
MGSFLHFNTFQGGSSRLGGCHSDGSGTDLGQGFHIEGGVIGISTELVGKVLILQGKWL